ncbi:Metallo-dependent phosphatase-like protein [Crucibulum laeve]|uniref:Sphingomyelin phosphodiesterase n=1 Tax=Crucibulum laeve TaxID=68775 RepID=A0A5C3LZP0_9AGAR|nr:Metallo-dependent phosphatase-like protein [Crucibulum laeve]
MFFSLRIWLVTLLFSLCVSASLVDDIISAIENAVDCASCHTLLVALQGLALLGDSIFDTTIITVCKTLKIVDDDVCTGIVNEQGPILAHDLRSISALGQTATKLCNVIGLCQPPAVNKYTVPFPKAAPTNPKTFESTGKAPFQVVHFSDVHIDRSYTTGAEVNCTKPICCRNYADQTGPTTVPAGPMGSHHCDTPGVLAQSMLKSVATKNTQFSIFTGDVVEAAVWLVNQQEVTNDLQLFNNEMSTLLNSPIFPVIGNHEVAPVNAFPRNTSSSPLSSQWVFDTQSQGWAQWINSTAAGQVQHLSGSYSVVAPGTNLRIISLNTIYWYKDNFWLYDSDKFQPDPNGILGFAVQQLQAAEDAGQRAWVIAHMPPSGGDAFHDQSNYFDQIVQRYRNTIAAQFYGHTHEDEFVIGYSDYDNQNANTADSIGWIAPSLTPRSGNPAFKVYDIDPDTYEVMDAHVLISDLADPSFQTAPTWKVEYSARETYGAIVAGGWPATQSLNAAFWHKVTEAFVTNDVAFQEFIGFKTRGVDVEACTGDCKTTTICGLRAMRAENNCVTTQPGINFRRRDLESEHTTLSHDDHCEGAGLGFIFGQMTSKNLTQEQLSTLRQELNEVIGDAA